MHVRPFPLLAVAIAAMLAWSPLPARADRSVSVDPNHTSIAFTVSHLTITHVSGTIPLRDATVTLGDNDLPTSVKASFDIAKISTQNDQRDGDLRSAHWFDVASDPVMTFVSRKIDPGTGGTFTMTGDLTMHGVTKPTTLNGKFGGKVKDDKGTHFGYTATGNLDRTQWGVGNMAPAIVGTTINVTIQVEAIEK